MKSLAMAAAAAIAMGSAFNDMGLVPNIGRGKHRTSADTKAGRQMVSPRYRSSNIYGQTFNGARECERRRAQITAGKLSPVYLSPIYRQAFRNSPEVYARPAKAWPPRA